MFFERFLKFQKKRFFGEKLRSSYKKQKMATKRFIRNFSQSIGKQKEVAIIDGARIPFTQANTTYKDLISYDLARLAIRGLIARNNLPSDSFDSIIWGTVVQEVKTSNLAREAGLGAGIPASVPAYTVSQACISSNRAIASAAEKILCGQGDVYLCGGSETFSDVPIRFSRAIRKRLLVANKALKKGPMGILPLLKGLKLKDLAPEPPAIKNFSTNEVMGQSSDRLAAKYGVSRVEQDEFAALSHQNASKAHLDGHYKQELIPVKGDLVENGIRAESTLESLSKLKAAFNKPHGTHTAANSSFLTDGAAAVILMNRSVAEAKKIPVRSILKDFCFVAVDPFESMLLGPSAAIERVLSRTKETVGKQLTIDDIDVVEFHEAFAGQVLANIRKLELDGIKVDMSKVNRWGGSLSIGHPFGATGARLVTTATNRLKHENKKYAIVAACADGGLGHACLIENV